MSERKVLNKYFPPDFDPALIPRRKLPKDLQHKVRLMTPFSMRCNNCGEYIYKGKKFNARKETTTEMYYKIPIYRFYIRCNRCAAEITFKTDPANSDYVAENGALRNFEPWRDEKGDIAAEREEEEENNPMKALENRTLDSKREMEIMDALDEIRTKNAQNERLDADTILNNMAGSEEDAITRKQQEEDEEDEKLAKAVFKDVDGERVKRLHDDQDDADEPSAVKIAMSKFSQPLVLPDFSAPVAKKSKAQGGLAGLVKSTKAASTSKQDISKTPTLLATSKPAATKPSLLSLVGSYGSDSDSD
ncbi:hypothetical protein BGZ76_008450 [Entomortierella beljakovae]|nr:hypothetical protein BGZ76_008450 [Entomortierella beljakovae]